MTHKIRLLVFINTLIVIAEFTALAAALWVWDYTKWLFWALLALGLSLALLGLYALKLLRSSVPRPPDSPQLVGRRRRARRLALIVAPAVALVILLVMAYSYQVPLWVYAVLLAVCLPAGLIGVWVALKLARGIFGPGY